jgi:uncharacterized protein YbjT (DUF2867 family)
MEANVGVPGRPRIIIAGASGYIGKAVLPALLERFPFAQVTALSRAHQVSDDPRITWKACDLFSLKALEDCLPAEADLAFYLVHSMGPTAQLDQGSFADYDLILADNFARMMQKLRIQQLIYLGGLIPEAQVLSLHLQSRLEMEETFAHYKLPTTFFRAGLILGEAGSSFQILLKLVKRLPVMICPRWTQNLTTPVDLDSVVRALVDSSLVAEHTGAIYDLAGCRPLTYMEMMKQTARRLRLKRWFFSVPVFTPTLSRLWVSLITRSPKNLVYPLIASLEHTMVARESHLFFQDRSQRTYAELLENASMKTHSGVSLFHFHAQRKTVRSVQRLPLPPGKNAAWIKDQYINWLPRFLSPLIHVEVVGAQVVFCFLNRRLKLLELRLSEDRSHDERQLLYIKGGILVSEQNRGRLEFRVALDGRCVLSAIHDYSPSLPWFAYKYTQAILHLLVMRAFARYLLASTGNET